MSTTQSISTVTRVFLRSRRAVPLAEFAQHIGLPYVTVSDRHRRGRLDFAVEQDYPATAGHRGAALYVTAAEVIRYDRARFAAEHDLDPAA